MLSYWSITAKLSIMQIHDKHFKIYLSRAEIQAQIQTMGEVLSQKMQGKKPVFLSILNGSFVLVADLVRACDFDGELGFVRLSSYDKLSSTGEVKMHYGLDIDLENKDVILIEDIVDTGNTLDFFLPVLEAEKPASITIASLLLKPEAYDKSHEIDIVGFEIPNKFVVGYGLDYDGLGRTLPDIWQLDEETV